MIANYHTHTPRCKHAQGTPREYVEAAICSGMKVLGFSDHVPYPFHNGFESNLRMNVSETENYVQEILELKEEYKNQIEIYVGYEAEYYPNEFERMLENIKKYHCDYLILGQHFFNNEYDGVYCGHYTENEEDLIHYVDQSITAMNTGVFTYFAHPDLIQYKGNDGAYTREITRLCQVAKEQQLPLEINLLGLRDHRQYPNPRFWEIAKEVGNDIILGSDAHSPNALEDFDNIKQAEKFAKDLGISLIERVQLKRIN